MILFVGKGLVRRRPHTLFGRNRPTKDGYVEHLILPWNRLATLAFGSEPEQLLWRDQVGNSKSIIIKSQADDVGYDTEERIVI